MRGKCIRVILTETTESWSRFVIDNPQHCPQKFIPPPLTCAELAMLTRDGNIGIDEMQIAQTESSNPPIQTL